MSWFGFILSKINQDITHLSKYSQNYEHIASHISRETSQTFINLSFIFLAEKWSLIQHRCNCIFGTKLFFSGQHYPPYTPSCIQITTLICQQDARDLEPCHQAECSCSYSSQNTHKKKTSQSIGQKFRKKQKSQAHFPSPLTYAHTHAHKHPHLGDRDRTDGSDLLIYKSFYIQLNYKMMWVQMDGDPGPDSLVGRTDKVLQMKKRKSFHQVHVESQLLACWWVSQNSELLSWEKPTTFAGPGQLMSCLLTHTHTHSLPPFLAPSTANVTPRESNL